MNVLFLMGDVTTHVTTSKGHTTVLVRKDFSCYKIIGDAKVILYFRYVNSEWLKYRDGH